MKLKCPMCYSGDIKKIIYGYPSDENYLLARKGEIILGGIEKDKKSAQYFCESCKKSFFEGISADGSNKNMINKMNFYYGSFCAPSHYLYIDKESENFKYGYSELGMFVDIINDEKQNGVFKESIHFSKVEIGELSNELEILKVKEWDGIYNGESKHIDKEWSLELEFADGTKYKGEGLNAFPDEFSKFLELIDKYTSKKIK